MTVLRHFFLTSRGQPLPRWLEAFPDGSVRPYPQVGTVLVRRPGEALIWLHLGQKERQPAARLKSVTLAAPSCRIIVLSNLPSETEGLACFEAGAAGYASALITPEGLRQVATVVEHGGLWVGAELMTRLRRALAAKTGTPPSPDRLAPLSRREREVALAVAEGASNKEVARALGITERTVKAHLSAIFLRLGVRDRMQLALFVNADRPATADKRHIH